MKVSRHKKKIDSASHPPRRNPVGRYPTADEKKKKYEKPEVIISSEDVIYKNSGCIHSEY